MTPCQPGWSLAPFRMTRDLLLNSLPKYRSSSPIQCELAPGSMVTAAEVAAMGHIQVTVLRFIDANARAIRERVIGLVAVDVVRLPRTAISLLIILGNKLLATDRAPRCRQGCRSERTLLWCGPSPRWPARARQQPNRRWSRSHRTHLRWCRS